MSAHYSHDFFFHDHYHVIYIVSTITVGDDLMWKGILCLRLLHVLLAGDSTVNGIEISIVPGHIEDPEIAKHIFVSPSIRYCTYGGIYAKSEM